MVSLAKTIFEPSGEKHGELSVAFVFVIFLKPPPEAFAVQISAFPLEVSTTATFEPSRENEPPVLLPLYEAKTLRVFAARSTEYKSIKPVLKYPVYIMRLPSGEKWGMRESDLSRVIERTFWKTMSETHISDVFQLSGEYENAIVPAKKPGERNVRITAASHAFIKAFKVVGAEQTCSCDVPFVIVSFTALAP